MMNFEWHEVKRQENIAEHGIDFADAALIFENPVVESEDTRNDYGETRYQAIGYIDDDWFFVVYTWRGENRRIISAWRIDDEGKRRYQALFARRP